MSRPALRKQLALPLLAAAVFGLALYLLHKISGEPLTAQAMTDPQNPLQWAMRLVSIAFWLGAAFAAVRALNELVFLVFRKRKGYDAPSLMRDIFSLVLYVTSVAVVLKLHFDALSFGALLSGSALLGVILGLALQDTLGNLFSGISLHADKPFQVGDVITVGKHIGVVMSITWRAVKIKTFSNHIVLVSNSSIAKESIEVCPRDGQNARIVNFSTVYTDSPVKVIHVVREAIRECENVLRYMTPVVRIHDLGESVVEWEVKYWLSDYARHNDTDALIRQRIWYAFRRNGFDFGSPVRTVYMAQAAEQDGERRTAETLAEILSDVDIFSPLSSDDLNTLALNLRRPVIAPCE